jgi:hypothetical protein
MIWLFALGIIALAVFHAGFRKVVLWILGGTVFFVVVYIIVMGHQQL